MDADKRRIFSIIQNLKSDTSFLVWQEGKSKEIDTAREKMSEAIDLLEKAYSEIVGNRTK